MGCARLRWYMKKHGIEPKFSKNRKIRLLSYAVYNQGNCLVSHETTRQNRIQGLNILNHMNIEIEKTKLPII